MMAMSEVWGVRYIGKPERQRVDAVEIEEAITQLADQPFDPTEFPFSFLEAFGNKETTIKRLRAGASNKSDLGGVLQTNNIHIGTCSAGQVAKTLADGPGADFQREGRNASTVLARRSV